MQYKNNYLKKESVLIFIGKRSKLRMKKKIKIGKGVNIGSDVVIDALSKEGVTIGNNVRIGDNCFFGCAGGISIWNDVIMGQNVRFHSENHNYNDSSTQIRMQGVSHKGIKVGNNCWIGSGVVILDGVSIGDGCVIGANTLVNKDISNKYVAVGSPVRLIKKRA